LITALSGSTTLKVIQLVCLMVAVLLAILLFYADNQAIVLKEEELLRKYEEGTGKLDQGLATMDSLLASSEQNIARLEGAAGKLAGIDSTMARLDQTATQVDQAVERVHQAAAKIDKLLAQQVQLNELSPCLVSFTLARTLNDTVFDKISKRLNKSNSYLTLEDLVKVSRSNDIAEFPSLIAALYFNVRLEIYKDFAPNHREQPDLIYSLAPIRNRQPTNPSSASKNLWDQRYTFRGTLEPYGAKNTELSQIKHAADLEDATILVVFTTYADYYTDIFSEPRIAEELVIELGNQPKRSLEWYDKNYAIKGIPRTSFQTQTRQADTYPEYDVTNLTEYEVKVPIDKATFERFRRSGK
jgi:hypothetical protein